MRLFTLLKTDVSLTMNMHTCTVWFFFLSKLVKRAFESVGRVEELLVGQLLLPLEERVCHDVQSGHRPLSWLLLGDTRL